MNSLKVLSFSLFQVRDADQLAFLGRLSDVILKRFNCGLVGIFDEADAISSFKLTGAWFIKVDAGSIDAKS